MVNVKTGFGDDFYQVTNGSFQSKQDKQIRGVSIRKIKVDSEGVQMQKSQFWVNVEAVSKLCKAMNKVADKIEGD